MRTLIALVSCVLACGDKKSDETPTPVEPATPESEPEASNPQLDLARLPDGLVSPGRPTKQKDAVYIATSERLLAIEGGEFVEVAKLPKYFRAADLAIDRDGNPWVLGGDSVARLEGDQFAVIKLTDGNGALEQLAVHDGSNLDVVGVYGISFPLGGSRPRWSPRERRAIH